MKTRDKWLMKVTEPVWLDLCEADCNPDIIPLCLCDAAEIGYNHGFAAGAAVVAATGACFLIGGWIANRFKKCKEK